MGEKIITLEDFRDRGRCEEQLRIIHSHVAGLALLEPPEERLADNQSHDRARDAIRRRLLSELVDEAFELLSKNRPDAYPLLLITGLLDDEEVADGLGGNPLLYQNHEWDALYTKMWQVQHTGGIVFFPSFIPQEQQSVIARGEGGKKYTFTFYTGTYLDRKVAQERTSIGIVNQMIRPFVDRTK